MPINNNFSDNVDRWLHLAELKIDYYTQFVKSWIPFNAWYMVSYSNSLNTGRDRDILDHIKDNPNPYKDRIINLLNSNSIEAKEFKELLGKLHYELEHHTVPHHTKKLTFSSLFIKKNPNSSHLLNYRNLVFKVTYDDSLPRTSNRLKCEIFDSSQNMRNIYLEEILTWDINLLNSNLSYNSLGTRKKENILSCFNMVNPNKKENVVVIPKFNNNGNCITPQNAILLSKTHNIYFINNPDLVSQALIEMLYQLRCILFHGEINPTETNQSIYKFAFQIQQILIQELR